MDMKVETLPQDSGIIFTPGEDLIWTLEELDNEHSDSGTTVLESPYQWDAENQLYQAKEGLPLTGGKADTALAIGKMVWDLIKENKPSYSASAPTTFILNAKDHDGLHYAGAKPFQSSWYRYACKTKLGVVASAKFQIFGYNHAQAPEGITAGNYLPTLGVRISKVKVAFSFTFDIKVQLTQPVNTGTHEQVNAGADLSVLFQVGGLFQTYGSCSNWRLSGNKGPKRL